jgi:hypothetical protein
VIIILFGVYVWLRIEEAKTIINPVKKDNALVKQMKSIARVTDQKKSQKQEVKSENFIIDDEETVSQILSGKVDSFI